MVGFVASLAGMWRNHDDRGLRLDRRCLHLKVGYRRAESRGGGLDSPQKAAMNRTSASGEPLEWNVPELPTFCSAAAKGREGSWTKTLCDEHTTIN